MGSDQRPKPSASFPTTRWSLVSRLKDGTPKVAADALSSLCHSYWYPLYAYARRFGLSEPDAKDVVQSLFARMITGNRFERADSERGKMRTFLLTALKHEISMDRERRSAEKRGGGMEAASLNMTRAEGRYLAEPASEETSPEEAFDRKWALEIVKSALDDLSRAYASEGKQRLYEVLSPCLDHGGWSGYGAASLELRMNVGAVRVALHRMRKRYRDILFSKVRETVETDEEVKTEAAYLMQLFVG